MIIANGHEYITLDDDFYVNGKKVLEAYANGQKVYPAEEKRGALVKFRGRKVFNESRTWGIDIPGLDSFYVDEFKSRLSGTSSFVVVYEIDRNVTDEIYFKTSGKCLSGAYVFPGNLYTQAFPEDSSETPLWRVNTMRASSSFEERANITSSLLMVSNDYEYCNCKMLYKQNITPFRIPMELKERFGSYGGSPAGYSVSVIDNSPFTWMLNEHNNKLYSFEEIRKRIYTGLTWTNICEEPNSELHLTIHGNGHVDPYCMNITMNIPENNKTAHTYNVTNVKKWGEPRPDTTGYLTGRYLNLSIPITEIMYIGDKYTAPEWAKNVYESDLEW